MALATRDTVRGSRDKMASKVVPPVASPSTHTHLPLLTTQSSIRIIDPNEMIHS